MTNPKVSAFTILCARQEVLKQFGDIRIAYGQSDEYSFVFNKSCNLYGVHRFCHLGSSACATRSDSACPSRAWSSLPGGLHSSQHAQVCAAGRRSSKLISLVTSCFSASYVRWWPECFPGQALQCTPMFDGRAVCYPTDAILRDYLAWRQADAHINNQVMRPPLFSTCTGHRVTQGRHKTLPEVTTALVEPPQSLSYWLTAGCGTAQFNTCFWALVKGGATRVEAQAALKVRCPVFGDEHCRPTQRITVMRATRA